ncbi:MAG: gamma-glutamylcyclotransferase [Chromatiales bacterium]|nr:gamma-glutamylcyclotransferase [Chromatiales bacterium]
MIYFAYGSNMSEQRLCARIPAAMRVAVGVLSGHQLKFHKQGMDDSAKCNIWSSGNAEDKVFGVLFEIPDTGKVTLDGYEGPGYQAVMLDIRTEQGVLSALAYSALKIDAELKPYDWYKEHVLRGARENRLPEQYIQQIEAVASISDPDRERHRKEMAIYD